MPLFSRPDGSPAKRVPSFTKMLPYLMKGRNESVLYHSHDFDMTNALALVKKLNKGLDKKKYGVFHIFLLAIGRTLAMRPRLNRFVSGRNIYQRHKIRISFVAKLELNEDSKEVNITIDIDPFETLDTLVGKLDAILVKKRKLKEVSADEKEIDVITKLPRFLINFIVWLFTKLDYFNLAPKSMIDSDPLYSSIFVANLGSVGIDSPFHHLFEWGNASTFIAIGKVKKIPVVNSNGKIVPCDIVNFKFSLDDRIGEAMYFGRALELLNDFVVNPAQLLKPPVIEEKILKQLDLK